MRHLLAGIITVALFSDAIAQTAAHPSPELSRQALRKQDRQVCTAQAGARECSKEKPSRISSVLHGRPAGKRGEPSPMIVRAGMTG